MPSLQKRTAAASGWQTALPIDYNDPYTHTRQTLTLMAHRPAPPRSEPLPVEETTNRPSRTAQLRAICGVPVHAPPLTAPNIVVGCSPPVLHRATHLQQAEYKERAPILPVNLARGMRLLLTLQAKLRQIPKVWRQKPRPAQPRTLLAGRPLAQVIAQRLRKTTSALTQTSAKALPPARAQTTPRLRLTFAKQTVPRPLLAARLTGTKLLPMGRVRLSGTPPQIARGTPARGTPGPMLQAAQEAAAPTTRAQHPTQPPEARPAFSIR